MAAMRNQGIRSPRGATPHHACGPACQLASVVDGQMVCPLTGFVLCAVMVAGSRSVAESARAPENAGGAFVGVEAPPAFFSAADRREASAVADFRAVCEVVRGALSVDVTPTGTSTAAQRAADAEADAALAARPGPLAQRFGHFVGARRVREEDRARAADLTRRVHAYYRWCSRAGVVGRIPKIRLFALAMLYVMKTGLPSERGPAVVPPCALCARRLPEVSRIPAGVLTDKQRALTTAIKFVKASFSEALRTHGLARVLSELAACR